MNLRAPFDLSAVGQRPQSHRAHYQYCLYIQGWGLLLVSSYPENIFAKAREYRGVDKIITRARIVDRDRFGHWRRDETREIYNSTPASYLGAVYA